MICPLIGAAEVQRAAALSRIVEHVFREIAVGAFDQRTATSRAAGCDIAIFPASRIGWRTGLTAVCAAISIVIHRCDRLVTLELGAPGQQHGCKHKEN